MNIDQRDIVLLPFKYAESDEEKPRPALVISSEYVNDDVYFNMIVCGISSTGKSRPLDIKIDKTDDENPHSTLRPSRIIPQKIELESQNRIIRRVGKLKEEKCEEVIKNLIQIISIEEN